MFFCQQGLKGKAWSVVAVKFGGYKPHFLAWEAHAPMPVGAHIHWFPGTLLQPSLCRGLPKHSDPRALWCALKAIPAD